MFITNYYILYLFIILKFTCIYYHLLELFIHLLYKLILIK
jgi:hypothetical protein